MEVSLIIAAANVVCQRWIEAPACSFVNYVVIQQSGVIIIKPEQSSSFNSGVLLHRNGNNSLEETFGFSRHEAEVSFGIDAGLGIHGMFSKAFLVKLPWFVGLA